MTMPHQVVNEATILTDCLGPWAVGHAGRLDDTRISTQVIDQTDKTVVQDWKSLIQYRFCFGNNEMHGRFLV
jgi:hypothetical protein